MSNEEQRTDSDKRVVMQVEKKPLHVRFVSLVATILLIFVCLIALDLFVSTVSAWIGEFHAGLTEGTLSTFVLSVRLSAFLSLATAYWFGFLGEKVYAFRAGRILRQLLILTVCLLIMFSISFGFGLIVFFALFLWAPKFTANWKNRTLRVYRSIFLAVVLLLMVLEFRFLDYFGIVLNTNYFVASLATQLTPSGLAWLSLIPAFFVIPLFLLVPNLIQRIWNLRSNVESFWKEFLHHKMGMVGLIIICVIVFIAVLAPLIAPYHWGAGSLQIEDLLQPPSASHPLGTNHRGEDIFSRLVYGSQISLLVGFVASVTAVSIGTTVGLISGYYGGMIDTILMRVTDIVLCLPTLPLMLIFLVLFGQGLQNVIVVIAILGWTGTARMVRSEALSLRERPLTEAAHALGGSDNYILFKHILPNTLPLILANMILGIVNAILSEAGIAFLGFVDIHGQPSWGILLHWAWKNAALLGNSWWWFIPPGLLIMLTTLGFVFVSHTADKVVNPRLRGRRG
ncbi:MAG: ABC transporter permease [Candidatus Thorarchaeota archaeon]|jgi:peptide/nickel transport system permease protein